MSQTLFDLDVEFFDSQEFDIARRDSSCDISLKKVILMR